MLLTGSVNCYIFHFKTWGLILFNAHDCSGVLLDQILVPEISHRSLLENVADPQDHRASQQLQIYPNVSSIH